MIVSTVWGTIVPLDLFQSSSNMCISSILTGFFTIVPFVLAFYLGPEYHGTAGYWVYPNAFAGGSGDGGSGEAVGESFGESAVVVAVDAAISGGHQQEFSYFDELASVYGVSQGPGSIDGNSSGSGVDGVWVPPTAFRDEEVAWVMPAFLGVAILAAFLGAARRGYVDDYGSDIVSVPVTLIRFRFATLNWSNIALVVGMLLEFLQLSALTLRLDLDLIGTASNTSGLGAFAHGMFLTTSVGFIPAFAVALTVMIVWYFVASAPTVLHVIESSGYNAKDISTNPQWRLAATVFGSLLSTTIFEVLVAGVNCNTDGYLKADIGMECWTGRHRAIGAVCLYGGYWFVVTSSYYIVQHNLFGDADLQVQMAWPHMLLCHVAKFAMVLVSNVYSAGDAATSSTIVPTAIMSAISIAVFAHAICFQCMHKGAFDVTRGIVDDEVNAVSNSLAFAALKACSLGAVAAVSIAGLAAVAMEGSAVDGNATAFLSTNITDTTTVTMATVSTANATADAGDTFASAVSLWIAVAGIGVSVVCTVLSIIICSVPSLFADARSNFQRKVLTISDRLAGAHTKMRAAWSPGVVAGWKWRVQNVVYDSNTVTANPRNENYLYLKVTGSVTGVAAERSLTNAANILELVAEERAWRKGGRFGFVASGALRPRAVDDFEGFDSDSELADEAAEGFQQSSNPLRSKPSVYLGFADPTSVREVACPACTFVNKTRSRVTCEMCDTALPTPSDDDGNTVDGDDGDEECTECSKQFPVRQGTCDPCDGMFYCNQCWALLQEFEESSTAPPPPPPPRAGETAPVSPPRADDYMDIDGAATAGSNVADAAKTPSASAALPSYTDLHHPPASNRADIALQRPSIDAGHLGSGDDGSVWVEAPASSVGPKPSVYLGFSSVDIDVDADVTGAAALDDAAPASAPDVAVAADPVAAPTPTAGPIPEATPAPTPTPVEVVDVPVGRTVILDRSNGGKLGVRFGNAADDRTGILIVGVDAHGPAHGKMEAGDIINTINGNNVIGKTMHDAATYMMQSEKVELGLSPESSALAGETAAPTVPTVISVQPMRSASDAIDARAGAFGAEATTMSVRTGSYTEAIIPVSREGSCTSMMLVEETDLVGASHQSSMPAPHANEAEHTAVAETMFGAAANHPVHSIRPASAIAGVSSAATSNDAAADNDAAPTDVRHTISARKLLTISQPNMRDTTMSQALKTHSSLIAHRPGKSTWSHVDQIWLSYSRLPAISYGGATPNAGIKALQTFTVPWWNELHNREFHDAQHALLQLEGAIRWECMSVPFLAALPDWRAAVKSAGWHELCKCAKILEAACSEPYVPAPEGFAAAADPEDVLLPFLVTGAAPFVHAEYEVAQQTRSRAIKRDLLAFVRDDRLSALLEKLLPDTGYLSMSPAAPDGKCTVELANPLVGTIVESGADGYGAGLGAKIVLSQTLLIWAAPSAIGIEGLKGTKGISVGLTSVAVSTDGEKYIFNDNTSYKGKVGKVLDTLGRIDWKTV